MSDIPPPHNFGHQLHSLPLIRQVEFIQADIPCSVCGYNLRGQAREGRCPECGAAVMEAFRGGQLTYADRDWLIRVRSGVNLVFWGIAGSIIFMCICMILGAWYFGQHASHFNPAAAPTAPSWIQIPAPLLGLAATLYMLAVVVRLAAPEPRAGDAGPPLRTGRTRTIVRLAWLCVIAQLISTPIVWLFGPDPANPASMSTAWTVYSVVLGVGFHVIYMIGFILLMLQLRDIARRDISPSLGKLFTVVMWSSAFAIAGVGIFGVGSMLVAVSSAQAFTAAAASTTTLAASTQIASPTIPGGGSIYATTMTTSGPTAVAYTPPAAFMMLLPFLGVAYCAGFFVFILGIVAAVQFYRALSKAITHNVGMTNVFAVSPPPGADSTLSG